MKIFYTALLTLSLAASGAMAEIDFDLEDSLATRVAGNTTVDYELGMQDVTSSNVNAHLDNVLVAFLDEGESLDRNELALLANTINAMTPAAKANIKAGMDQLIPVRVGDVAQLYGMIE